MKIVIAPDSFKGSLRAAEAATAIDSGITKAFPEAECILVPMADGGEGTMETLVASTEGDIRHQTVVGPLGSAVEAGYGILGDGKTCVIEMATASGLDLVPQGMLSPLTATTYGTGQLIRQAIDDGFTSFILAIGGSATNDAGAGMLQALGLKILDKEKKQIAYGGGQLHLADSLDFSEFDARIKNCTFLIASDVENPLIGPNGASHVFGPQKGADPETVELLDKNLTHWADLVAEATGIRLHNLAGAGAAGGIGGAFQAFFPSQMKRGIDVVMEYSKLDTFLEGADLVITGEGRVDFQTASGKTPFGVAQAAHKREVPTIILAGSVGKGIDVLYEAGVVSVHSIINRPMALEEAIIQAQALLEESAEQIIRTYFH